MQFTTELRLLITVSIIAVVVPTISRAAEATPWTPINPESRSLEVASQIQGIDGWSTISTGTTITLLNEAFLEAKGLPYASIGETRTISFGGEVEERRYYEDIEAKLFNQKILFRSPIVGRRRDASRQLVLAGNFLQDYILQVEYPNRRMRLLSRDALPMRKLKNVPSRKGPLIKVNLNGEKDLWLLVSTEWALGIFVEHHIAKQAGWLDRYPVKQHGPEILGHSSTEFRLPSVTIGPHELGNVQVLVYADGKRSRLAKRYNYTGSHLPDRSYAKGIVGYEVLKHFVVTVDYKSGHTHLGIPE